MCNDVKSSMSDTRMVGRHTHGMHKQCTHACTHTRTHTHTHKESTHTRAHKCTHTYTCTNMRGHVCAHTHTHKHIHTHAHTHTHATLLPLHTRRRSFFRATPTSLPGTRPSWWVSMCVCVCVLRGVRFGFGCVVAALWCFHAVAVGVLKVFER
jgi:hypothetical protein